VRHFIANFMLSVSHDKDNETGTDRAADIGFVLLVYVYIRQRSLYYAHLPMRNPSLGQPTSGLCSVFCFGYNLFAHKRCSFRS